MPENHFNIKGLTGDEVLLARKKFGENSLQYKQENTFLDALKSLAKEPMIILLLVASLIYFVSGLTSDGLFLVSAIVVVSLISLYQDSRSRNALQKLKQFTQPSCKVIRDGITVEINSEDLVVGDSLIIEEGTLIVADG
ncbi:MAG: cation-transporting P-type ATPase, partial [Kaistella sp.]